MRQRLSRPFGRPSPAYTEREAMGDLVKLIRENITHRYETGYAVRARDCSGRTRVEMLDGTGGSDLGLANACDDGVVVGSGGVAEIWWAQRSQGRTVRLQYDLGTRAGRSTFEKKTFPASREMPVAAPVVSPALVAVGSSEWTYAAARSTDQGETWTPIVSTDLPTTPRCVCYGGGTFVVGGKGSVQIAYSTDSGETWTSAGQIFGSGFGDEVLDIAWNGNVFCAVGKTSASGKQGIATSADGITWSQVSDAAKTGMEDGSEPIRVTAAGTTLYVATSAVSYQCIGISTDDGASWQGYALQTTPDAVNDPAWFDAYPLSSTYPVAATSGGLVVTAGTSPRHSVIATGNTLTDATVPGDWDFTTYNTGQMRLISSGGQYCTTYGYINDGATTSLTLSAYPGSSPSGVNDILWDGTNFYLLAADWDGNSLGWLCVGPGTGAWTNYFLSDGACPGGLDSLQRMRKIGTRYYLCGATDDGSAWIPIAYSDSPTSAWTQATAAEGIFVTARDIAGEE